MNYSKCLFTVGDLPVLNRCYDFSHFHNFNITTIKIRFLRQGRVSLLSSNSLETHAHAVCITNDQMKRDRASFGINASQYFRLKCCD